MRAGPTSSFHGPSVVLASAASTSASAWSSSSSCSPRRTISLPELALDLAPELAPELELALELAPELDLAPELAPELELALELGLAPEAFRLRSSPPVGQGVPPPPSPPLPPPPPPSLLPLLADLGPIRTRNS
jgi:hypothetical protein